MEPPAEAAPDEVNRLADHFQTLASPIRLRLLFALAEPSAPGDLRITAGEERADLRADRLLNRSTVQHHLDTLEKASLVRRIPNGRLVVNHQILFSILQEVARLARIRPGVEIDVGHTRVNVGPDRTGPAAGPRLLLVGGPREGTPFPLAGAGPWTIGRGPSADVRLDYDPHVSRLHAVVHRDGAATFEVESPTTTTNPASVDFEAIFPGKRARLPPSAVLAVGSSRLVMQQ